MTDQPGNLDADAALSALAEQTAPLIAACPEAIIVGIETGGAWIGERLHTYFELASPLCSINVSFYRDDFSTIGLHPSVGPSNIPADINDKTVILVDDVLYTGRTLRAALNELFDYGRPAAVRLAVLVDRGTRELPFAPDAVGARLTLDREHRIKLTGPDPLRLIVR